MVPGPFQGWVCPGVVVSRGCGYAWGGYSRLPPDIGPEGRELVPTHPGIPRDASYWNAFLFQSRLIDNFFFSYFSSQWFCILALQDVPSIYVVDDPRCFGGRARQNYFHYDAELGNCVQCRSRCPEKSETNRHNYFERREDCMKICKYE